MKQGNVERTRTLKSALPPHAHLLAWTKALAAGSNKSTNEVKKARRKHKQEKRGKKEKHIFTLKKTHARENESYKKKRSKRKNKHDFFTIRLYCFLVIC